MLRKLGTRTPLYLRLYLYWSGQVQVRYVVSTTYYLLPTTDYRLPVRHYLGDVPCLAKNNEGSMLVERSMLTMRIERSICPLTMLVERSMLTMRIERSICPLTRWMFATILVRRRLWSFLERLNLSQYWTLPNDFRMISYFRDEAEKVTTDPHDYPASVDGQGAARYTVPPGRRL